MGLNKRFLIIGSVVFAFLIILVSFLAIKYKNSSISTSQTVWFESFIDDKVSFNYSDAKSYVSNLGYDKAIKNVYLSLDYQKLPAPDLPMGIKISVDHSILMVLDQTN